MNEQITTNGNKQHIKKYILEHKKHKNEYKHISQKYKTWASRPTLNNNS